MRNYKNSPKSAVSRRSSGGLPHQLRFLSSNLVGEFGVNDVFMVREIIDVNCPLRYEKPDLKFDMSSDDSFVSAIDFRTYSSNITFSLSDGSLNIFKTSVSRVKREVSMSRVAMFEDEYTTHVRVNGLNKGISAICKSFVQNPTASTVSTIDFTSPLREFALLETSDSVNSIDWAWQNDLTLLVGTSAAVNVLDVREKTCQIAQCIQGGTSNCVWNQLRTEQFAGFRDGNLVLFDQRHANNPLLKISLNMNKSVVVEEISFNPLLPREVSVLSSDGRLRIYSLEPNSYIARNNYSEQLFTKDESIANTSIDVGDTPAYYVDPSFSTGERTYAQVLDGVISTTQKDSLPVGSNADLVNEFANVRSFDYSVIGNNSVIVLTNDMEYEYHKCYIQDGGTSQEITSAHVVRNKKKKEWYMDISPHLYWKIYNRLQNGWKISSIKDQQFLDIACTVTSKINHLWAVWIRNVATLQFSSRDYIGINQFDVDDGSTAEKIEDCLNKTLEHFADVASLFIVESSSDKSQSLNEVSTDNNLETDIGATELSCSGFNKDSNVINGPINSGNMKTIVDCSLQKVISNMKTVSVPRSFKSIDVFNSTKESDEMNNENSESVMTTEVMRTWEELGNLKVDLKNSPFFVVTPFLDCLSFRSNVGAQFQGDSCVLRPMDFDQNNNEADDSLLQLTVLKKCSTLIRGAQSSQTNIVELTSNKTKPLLKPEPMVKNYKSTSSGVFESSLEKLLQVEEKTRFDKDDSINIDQTSVSDVVASVEEDKGWTLVTRRRSRRSCVSFAEEATEDISNMAHDIDADVFEPLSSIVEVSSSCEKSSPQSRVLSMTDTIGRPIFASCRNFPLLRKLTTFLREKPTRMKNANAHQLYSRTRIDNFEIVIPKLLHSFHRRNDIFLRLRKKLFIRKNFTKTPMKPSREKLRIKRDTRCFLVADVYGNGLREKYETHQVYRSNGELLCSTNLKSNSFLHLSQKDTSNEIIDVSFEENGKRNDKMPIASRKSLESTFHVKGLPGLLQLARLVEDSVDGVPAGNYDGVFTYRKCPMLKSASRTLMLLSLGFPSSLVADNLDEMKSPIEWYRHLFNALCYGRGDLVHQIVTQIRAQLTLIMSTKGVENTPDVQLAWHFTKLFRKCESIKTGEEQKKLNNILKNEEASNVKSPTRTTLDYDVWTSRDWSHFADAFLNQQQQSDSETIHSMFACVHFLKMVFENYDGTLLVDKIFDLMIPIEQKLLFAICQVSSKNISGSIKRLFEKVHGLDRLAFIGLGCHPDSLTVLLEDSATNGDCQLTSHLLLIGRCSLVESLEPDGLYHFNANNSDLGLVFGNELREKHFSQRSSILADVFPTYYLKNQSFCNLFETRGSLLARLHSNVCRYLLAARLANSTLHAFSISRNWPDLDSPMPVVKTDISCVYCCTNLRMAFSSDVSDNTSSSTKSGSKRRKRGGIISSLSGCRDSDREEALPQAVLEQSAGPMSQHACKRCGKHLPRCTVCTLYYQVIAFDTDNSAGKMANQFSVCQYCNHGGHTQHLVSWFSKETECPVFECNCRCLVSSKNVFMPEEYYEKQFLKKPQSRCREYHKKAHI